MTTLFPTSLDGFLNPTPSNRLDATGADPRLVHSTQHTNLNDSVSALEAKLGINFSSVTTSLDYIATLLLLTQTEHGQGVRRVIVGQPFPSNIVWYADNGGTIKLVEKKYTYDAQRNITKIELFLYDGTMANVLKRTVTDLRTLSGPFEVSRNRVVT